VGKVVGEFDWGLVRLIVCLEILIMSGKLTNVWEKSVNWWEGQGFITVNFFSVKTFIFGPC